jgi:hypothetical protein
MQKQPVRPDQCHSYAAGDADDRAGVGQGGAALAHDARKGSDGADREDGGEQFEHAGSLQRAEMPGRVAQFRGQTMGGASGSTRLDTVSAANMPTIDAAPDRRRTVDGHQRAGP